MSIELTADITPELIKTVSRRFTRRFLGMGYIFLIVLSVASILYEVLTNRANTWMTGSSGVLVGILVIFPIAMWRSIEQKGLDRLRRMPKPQMRFIFDERGVTFDSDLGTSTMSWLSVESIWEFPEAWLLMFGEQRFLTVPCSILTEEVKTMIKTKVSKKDPPTSQLTQRRDRRVWLIT